MYICDLSGLNLVSFGEQCPLPEVGQHWKDAHRYVARSRTKLRHRVYTYHTGHPRIANIRHCSMIVINL